MVHVVEEALEIEEEDVPLPAMLPDMPAKVLRQPIDGEVVPLLRQAGAVVMDEGAAEDRVERLVAERPLHYPFPDGGGSDMPGLAPLKQIEFKEAWALVRSPAELVIYVVHTQGRGDDELLNAGLPGDALPAEAVGAVQIGIGKDGRE